MNSPTKLSLGDISVNFARIILETLEGLGYSSKSIAAQFGLHKEFLDTPGARISIPRYMRIGYQAIQISKEPALGLLIGPNTSNTDLGIAGLAAISSPTLEDALKLLIKYELLNSYNSRGSSSFAIEDGRAICQFYSISPYNQFNYFVVDAMLSTWWKFIATNANGRPECHHIEIEYPRPSYAEAFEKHFKCPVLFNCNRNALVLTRGHHTLPMRERCAPTFKHMLSFCDDQLQRLKSNQRTKDHVVELISKNLTGSPPTIESIARQVGLGSWTLRRRLQNEGTDFREVLDSTRKALSLTYVRDTEHNFTEIAFLLGFSSPAAFQRAFKRWTNHSPGEFRTKYDQE